jgi:hypothetical protein
VEHASALARSSLSVLSACLPKLSALLFFTSPVLQSASHKQLTPSKRVASLCICCVNIAILQCFQPRHTRVPVETRSRFNPSSKALPGSFPRPSVLVLTYDTVWNCLHSGDDMHEDDALAYGGYKPRNQGVRKDCLAQRHDNLFIGKTISAPKCTIRRIKCARFVSSCFEHKEGLSHVFFWYPLRDTWQRASGTLQARHPTKTFIARALSA